MSILPDIFLLREEASFQIWRANNYIPVTHRCLPVEWVLQLAAHSRTNELAEKKAPVYSIGAFCWTSLIATAILAVIRTVLRLMLSDSNTNVNSMINRRVSLFYRYPLKAFHHIVCPHT